MLKKTFLLYLSFLSFFEYSWSQANHITSDHVYQENIKTVQLIPTGRKLNMPIINMGGREKLTLDFDDLDGDVKNYYYTIVLCNSDWKPSSVSSFDYLEGFMENRIDDYHFSTQPLQQYTHYKLTLPNKDMRPKIPGNYLLKVYLDGDTSDLAFTRRFMVTSNKAIINGKIEQPVNPKTFRTHQKVNFDVSLKGVQVNNPLSQVKVFVLQNGRWDNSIQGLKPTFVRGDQLVYNTEDQSTFPAMKEWRWADLRSFRLQTERVRDIINSPDQIDVVLDPDPSRSRKLYTYRRDINGQFIPDILEQGYHSDYEGDYAWVHFTFATPNPFPDSKIYVFGELTNYECNSENELKYNSETHAYEGELYLKQGYYNYIYGIIPNGSSQLQTDYTEGNWWETENDYTILVYYRPIGGRYDQLIGIRTLNSLEER